MYPADNNDTFPLNINRGDPSSAQPGSWVVGNAQTDTNTSNLASGSLFSYLKGVGVYRCPGDTSLNKRTGNVRTRSYSLSVWLNGYTSDSCPSYAIDSNPQIDPLHKTRLNQLIQPQPVQTYVFAEENEQSIDDGMMVIENSAEVSNHAWWDMPSDRHNRSGSVSFADNHVESVKWLAPKRFVSHGQPVGPAKEDWQDFGRAQSWVPVK
jgi:prepilin-type processing-associated H-X9-DG protein